MKYEMRAGPVWNPRIKHLPSPLKTGAPGRTRTDVCGFTKPALWLLRHRGSTKLALSRGLAPRALSFAGRCANLLHLESKMKLASVAGLAPARSGLKFRSRELFCIHGRKLAAGVGLAPTPAGLQPAVQTRKPLPE